MLRKDNRTAFIELDGTLSLDIADTTFHSENDPLNWSVRSHPKADDDRLMMQIRYAPADRDRTSDG